MPELATSEYEIILFYNPNSPSGKKTFAYAKGEGFPVRDVDILKHLFTGHSWKNWLNDYMYPSTDW